MWAVAILLMVIGGIEHRWILDNWKWLMWPTLIAIVLVAKLGGKETTGWGEPGKSLIDCVFRGIRPASSR